MQLIFEDPKNISIGRNFDKIKVIFVK